MTVDQDTVRTLALTHRFERLNSAIISDAAACKGVVGPGLTRFSGSGTVAGRVVTAQCGEGSVMAIFPTLEHARPGDILCVSGPGASAYLGGLLLTYLAQLRLKGAVIDGLIRDRDEVSGSPLSIFARGLTPANRRARDPGKSMVDLIIGEVIVHPGDWIVADSDGVVVVSPQEAESVLLKAEGLASLEERIYARVNAGEKPMDAVRAETSA